MGMEKIFEWADIANLVLDVPLVILAIKVVLRTEGALDRMAKLLLVTILMSTLAALLTVNKHLGIFSGDFILFATSIIRLLFLLIFIWAMYIFLHIVSSDCKVK